MRLGTCPGSGDKLDRGTLEQDAEDDDSTANVGDNGDSVGVGYKGQVIGSTVWIVPARWREARSVRRSC